MARFLGLQGTVQLRFYCIVLVLLLQEGVQQPLGLFLGFSFTSTKLKRIIDFYVPLTFVNFRARMRERT